MTDETQQAAEATDQSEATDPVETPEGAAAEGSTAAEASAEPADATAAAEQPAETAPGEPEPITDPQVLAMMDASIALAASLVQVKRPGVPSMAWHDGGPETRAVEGGDVTVFLPAGSDGQQTVRLAGHEAMHVVCGLEARHWGHEMIAEVFSLDIVRRQHDPILFGRSRAAADRNETVPEGLEPPFTLGLCYRTGDALLRVMKPTQLFALGRYPASDEGVEEWLSSLPPKVATKARSIIDTVQGS